MIRLQIRTATATNGKRNAARGNAEQHDMEPRLSSQAERSDAKVSVAVARKQHRLEEDHDGVPDSGGSAEQREQFFAHQRLDREEKGCT